MSRKKQSTRRSVPVQGSFHFRKKPPLLSGQSPRRPLSLDAFGFESQWEELLATDLHVTYPAQGAWWARALEGQLCWEMLLKQLRVQPPEEAWVHIVWRRVRTRNQTWCVLRFRSRRRRSRREWGDLRTVYIPQRLWPLARAAAYYLQCRDRLERLLGP